ncbi:MAG: hypothetical protein [Inoviridae sp.]|nr:MAG: hypothetical protein [Inoviridae sp.]
MTDDVNTSFLDNPVEALESVEDAIDENKVADETDKSDLSSDDVTVSNETESSPETSGELVGETGGVSSSVGDSGDYAYSIYGSDVPITSISRAADDDMALLSAGETAGGFNNDLVYTVTFDGSTYYLLCPADKLDCMAISDGKLLNVGNEAVTMPCLTDRAGSLVNNTVFYFYPLGSSSGVQSSLRYGGYCYRRVYTPSGSYNQYTGADTYGNPVVVEEPGLFAGKSYAPYVIFALFAVAGFYVLKKLFRRREVL